MQAKSAVPSSALTFDHHKWISCSHWGLFPLLETSSKASGDK